MVVRMMSPNTAVIVLIVFGLTVIFASLRSGKEDDKYVLLSRHVYEELLEAVKQPVIYTVTADTTVHEVPKAPEPKRICDEATSVCKGFASPQYRDVPGTGDIFNGQVASLDQCAERCYRAPLCRSFEFSPSAKATAAVKNCQIASQVGPLGNAYLDFKLYIKDREISKPLVKLRAKNKPQANPAPGPVEASDCKGMVQVSYGIESRMQPRAAQLRQELQETHYPSYDQMYKLIENHPYLPHDNIWTNFTNPFGMKPNFVFPFSNLHPDALDQVLQLLGRTPKFAVEVGSFHGHSAILQAKIFKLKFPDNPPYLLCIDAFIGDLGMLLFRDDWENKITPGEIRNGRSTSYWQFMLNVNSTINGGDIDPKQILPLVTSSVVGARFLIAIGATPDMVYLDSAHEANEVFFEVSLYFDRLASGGVLFGDDFSWEGVGNDVTKFAKDNGLQIHQLGATWAIKKSGNPRPSSQ